MQVRAFAKVSLGLSVFKKQNNLKKHDFESIFLISDQLYDVVNVEINNIKRDSVHYFIDDKEIYVYSKLVYRVLDWLRKDYNLQNYYKINIHKKIPIGSGLGGGSSNAAAIMNAIAQIEQLNQFDLKQVAKLGSDIPFFLTNYKAGYIKGDGASVEEIIVPDDFSFDLHLMNVNVNTKLVYQLFDSNSIHVIRNDFHKIINDLKKGSIQNVYNDLEDYCFKLYPNIQHQYQELKQKYEYVLLSGSGSTFVCYKKKG
ncbi:hypothetical protein [Ureaplasma diversum]|uniref:4-diphosphocytidyl-2-C-methyl-D-erythritol kinase n=1 Tax=Ureaplasma diversum NCTC 246 TaxID=1188241 RepID=A0A084EZQ4_9BACT|nr:hypothetical protein [Ureaplasma diversum]KEZ23446.1 Hypothetical protein, predicted kinase [Ureaplasma diversum NCTC 246]